MISAVNPEYAVSLMVTQNAAKIDLVAVVGEDARDLHRHSLSQ